jgi:pyruvate formate lyase activating enzyme
MSQTGIIFDVKRFAVHDGPGIRTTIFFKGCPLDCQWCHNPESRHLRPERLIMNGHHRCPRWLRTDEPDVVGKEVSVDECIREIEKDVVFYDQSGGGVTFSGGEPLIQPDFLEAVLRECSRRGIHTAIDTSGHARWPTIEPLLEHTDLFLYDLKLVDEDEHRSWTGVGTRTIHENLRLLHDAGARIIVRVPLIPGVTDTTENLAGIGALVGQLPLIREINLLPYNSIAPDKYRRMGKSDRLGRLQRQTEEDLLALKSLFAESDIEVKVG